MLPTNAAAAAARAPPPAPASSARPPSGIPSFASGGFGPAAPAAAGSGSYTTGTGYGGVNMARLPMGVNSGTEGSDIVARNTRKKARLG